MLWERGNVGNDVFEIVVAVSETILELYKNCSSGLIPMSVCQPECTRDLNGTRLKRLGKPCLAFCQCIWLHTYLVFQAM